jgi:hypothetical protein
MKTIDQAVAGSSADRIWKALRPSLPHESESAGADEPNEMRRLMLQSQEFRSIMPSAELKSADKRGKGLDSTTIDIVFACLGICADEERRAMSIGSTGGATAMRRAMHAIKEKFDIS